MSFSFLAGNALEILHFRGDNRWADEANVVQLSHLAATLVVLDENLYVLYILKFDVAQIHLLAGKIFRVQPKMYGRCV